MKKTKTTSKRKEQNPIWIISGIKMGILLFFILMGFLGIQAQPVGPVEISTAGGYGEKKMKSAPRKVYISEFRVMYQLMYHQEDEDKGGRTLGGGLRGKATASVTLGIKGVDVPDLKEVTNKLYQEYSQKVKQQGFELVSAEEAAKTKTLEDWELKNGGDVNEAQFKGYLMTTPENYQYLVKRTSADGKEKKGFMDISGKLSKDLGGAIVAKVNLVVPMVEDAESGGSKMLKGAAPGVAKVVLRPNLRLTNEAMLSSTFSTDLTTTSARYFYMKSLGEQGICITSLKKPVEIAGVLPDKKYKATAVANTDVWGKDAGYFTVFSVNDEMIANMQAIECDRDQYVQGVTEASEKFLNSSLDELFSNTK
ncbi:MAG: hypothetical protein WC384_21935 [Prolixibacteraceae bacterium]